MMFDYDDDYDDDDYDDGGLEKAAGRGGKESKAEAGCLIEKRSPTHWYKGWSCWET